jgi:hypothetical protein
MKKRALILAAAVPMSCALGLAQSQAAPKLNRVPARLPQPEVRVSIESNPTRLAARDSRFDSIVSGLDAAKLVPVVPGSWEAQVVTGVRNSAGNTIRLHLQDPDRPAVLTFATTEGDVLLARWNAADPGRPDRATWLWDTPYWDIFIVEVDATVLRGDELTSYCEGLFVWDNGTIELRSLRLTYLNSEPGKQEVVGIGEYLKTERGIYNMGLSALARGDRGYIGVSLSKSIAGGSEPGASWVRERFPPLRDRLVTWTREALLEEVGKNSLPKGTNAPTFLSLRDAIVLRELLSRGPVSDAEVRRILFGGLDRSGAGTSEFILERVIAFLDALESRNEMAAYAPSLESAFLGAPIHPAYEGAVMGHVVAAMDRHGIDFSRASLSFLERGQYVGQSLWYLGNHARDAETLRKMESIPVRPEMEDAKKYAVRGIRQKLGLPVNDR